MVENFEKRLIVKWSGLAIGVALAIAPLSSAKADKLDDIIASGKLRCAVTLDFPPMGSRDASNTPIGFDVDYCNDLAKSLGVKAEVVETPFSDRIPALVSGRADIGVASTSDTLERAKTVGFTIPYFAFKMVILTKQGLGLDTYDKLKGHKLGDPAGTYEALALESDVKKWNDPSGTFRAYQTQADVFLALGQNQIDATVTPSTSAAAIVKEGKYKNFVITGDAPFTIDYVSLITLRQDQGLLNYLNLFINQQVRTGRYKALYDKWIAIGDAPNLTIPGVYR
jgi:polar amino acid transport system substrate-binding protein